MEKTNNKDKNIKKIKNVKNQNKTEVSIKNLDKNSSSNITKNKFRNASLKNNESINLKDNSKDIKENNNNLKQNKLEDKIEIKENEKIDKTPNEKIDEDFNRKNGFIKFLKSFTPYQIIYLLSVIVLVTLFCIFLPDEMLETDNNFVLICSIIAVIANPVCELMISKQNKWNFIVSIVFIEVTESVLYFSLGAYSVAIISLVFWIPIDLFSFFNWKKHPDEEKDILTKVRRLSWKQDILLVFLIFAYGIGVGYLLTLIPGVVESYPEPFFNYLDAFVSAVGMANGILLLIRYNEQWFAWGLTLILDAVLYIYTGSYIMLITVGAMMVNTIYGFIKWLIYIKNHKKENIESANLKN